MQNPFGGKQPIGVIYNTPVDRPDAVLALALLYGLQGKREARVGSVCVNGAGLGSAMFCDILSRFYNVGPPRNANQVLPTGFAPDKSLPDDNAMVKAAIDKPVYPRDIKKVTDTSLPEAVLRNGVIFNAEAVVVLSAPATYLAKTLDLLGTRDLYKERVKRLVVVDSGAPQDAPALKRIMDEWPSPIFLCGKDVGEAVRFPGASIATDFSWAPDHPVADAYKAFQPMPYDAPTWDMAAIHYAVHPDSGFFDVVDAPGASGRVKALKVNAARQDELRKAYVELASAKPPAPQQRRPRP